MLSTLTAPVQRELEAARAILRRELRRCDPAVAEFLAHAFAAPGKGLRPAVLLLCGKATGPLGERHVAAAAAIELIHGATLVHDDVIDAATRRRRRSTVNARWGTEVSILLGDLLFARSLGLLAAVATAEQQAGVFAAVSETCEGELLQLLAAGREAVGEERYLAIIEKKTGALYGAAAALGAALAGAPADRVERFTAFGRRFGVAFQIADDCLDIRGDEDTVGKTLGTDLAGGRATLPVLYAREHAAAEQRHHLDHLLASAPGEERRARLAALFHECGAFDYCERSAREFTRQAVAALDFLEDGPARDSLLGLADYAVARRR